MKSFLTGLSFILCCSLLTENSFAVTSSNKQLTEYVNKLVAQTNELAAEVKNLRKEVKQLKQRKSRERIHRQNEKYSAGTIGQVKQEKSSIPAYKVAHRVPTRQTRVPLVPSQASDERIPKGWDYLIGAPVVTSPYMGIRSEFDGSDLIVNLSTINEDVRFLEHRQRIEHFLHENNIHPQHEHIVDLSGRVEVLSSLMWPYSGGPRNDIDLATAELDTLFHVNDWVMGFIGIKYDKTPPAMSAQRAPNSRLFLDEGFVTIGNLDRSPFYMTAGQFFVPFGHYSIFPLSVPTTAILGQTKARAVLLGVRPKNRLGFYSALYTFEGDTRANGGNQGGINFGYKGESNGMTFNIGGGVIASIADSDGMQASGLTTFPGFGASAAAERLNHQVFGYNVHANLDIKPFSFVVEYIGAGDHFSASDLTYNGRPAKPSAVDFEAAYHFNIGEHPSNFAVSYSHSAEALGINIPEHRYLIAFNTAIWQHTIATLEFRHDENYALNSVATGRVASSVTGATCTTAGCISAPVVPAGKSANAVTLQFSVYF